MRTTALPGEIEDMDMSELEALASTSTDVAEVAMAHDQMLLRGRTIDTATIEDSQLDALIAGAKRDMDACAEALAWYWAERQARGGAGGRLVIIDRSRRASRAQANPLKRKG